LDVHRFVFLAGVFMTESLPAPERPWRLYITLAVVTLLVAVPLFFADRQEPSGEPSTTAPAEADLQRRCEEQLAGIMAALDPRELGLSSSQLDRAHDLNLWQSDCGALFAAQRIAQDAELVERLLPAQAVARVQAEAFTSRDAAHLRTTVLLRQAAQHASRGIDSPLDQAVTLFNFVRRNVLEFGPDAPTMTPYEILLLGRGSAEQRAWLYAELLRQIELDAVIVRPADRSVPADRWLVGVPVTAGDAVEVYLFDMLAGVPIPAASEATATTVSVTQPATLSEVRAQEDLLRRLDLPDNPYRFTAADLKQVQVGLIGHSSLWSNRVATLDFATELRGAIFYDGLGENRLRQPGLHERIVRAGAAGGWTGDAVFVWDFPEAELEAYGTPGARGQALIANYLAMLAGPTVRDIVDPATGQKLTWSHSLIDARNLHITGVYGEAIREYNQIRGGIHLFTENPLNDLCRESAVYWTTACQYELKAYDSVINTALRGHYPPPFATGVQPIWPDGMASLAAHALAATGAYGEAVALLGQVNLPAPHGRDYLIQRWRRLGIAPEGDASPSGAPAASPAETPTETAPSPPASAPDAAATNITPPGDAATESPASPAPR
jgi:hypothetical protein